jgi:hypothetical protein
MSDRTMKVNDSLDYLSGIARTDGVRQDLSAFNALEIHVKSPKQTTYASLAVEDVEAVDGAGTPGVLNAQDGLPENRGKWRATAALVVTADQYRAELEATTPSGKKVHFPSAAANNPTLTVDPDLSGD